MSFALRPLSRALALALAGVGLASLLAGPAQARPDADHPAVARALAQLKASPQALAAGTGHDFRFKDLVLDADGVSHVRFVRQYRGLPVVGGDLVVHSNAKGQLQRISQTLRRAPDLAVAPSLGSAEALNLASAAFGGELRGTPSTQAVVYARGAKAPRLAWQVELAGVLANGRAAREVIVVDAQGGQVLDRWATLHSAAAPGTGVSLYSGTVSLTTDSQAAGGFLLRDPSRGNHEVYDLKGKDAYFSNPTGTLMADADNAWGDGVQSRTSQSDGVDALYGFAETWDFYLKRFGRNGIADDGRGGKSRVHANNWGGVLYNAFWSDDCFCMTYTNFAGPGNGALVSLDVAGHEMTHGVTSHSAGLIYSGESGGLNEASSDILGNMVERFAKNSSDPADYLVGEQIFGASAPLRDMIQPSTDGASADCWYDGVGNLDVHYSSGVANHMFYILAEGSQPAGGRASPTCQAGDTRVATGSDVVRGIGARDASSIYYRALTVYMTSDTDHAGARDAMVSAARDLFGATSDQVKRVRAAWKAVGVR